MPWPRRWLPTTWSSVPELRGWPSPTRLSITPTCGSSWSTVGTAQVVIGSMTIRSYAPGVGVLRRGLHAVRGRPRTAGGARGRLARAGHRGRGLLLFRRGVDRADVEIRKGDLL